MKEKSSSKLIEEIRRIDIPGVPDARKAKAIKDLETILLDFCGETGINEPILEMTKSILDAFSKVNELIEFRLDNKPWDFLPESKTISIKWFLDIFYLIDEKFGFFEEPIEYDPSPSQYAQKCLDHLSHLLMIKLESWAAQHWIFKGY